jgi:hypothetical protein
MVNLAKSKKSKNDTYNTGFVPKIDAFMSSGSTIEFNSTARKLKINMFEYMVDLDLGFIIFTIRVIRNDRIKLVMADTREAQICRVFV